MSVHRLVGVRHYRRFYRWICIQRKVEKPIIDALYRASAPGLNPGGGRDNECICRIADTQYYF
jgi:hypothetical protein